MLRSKEIFKGGILRIGLIVQLHGAPGTSRPPHTWERLRELARTAEAVGFDSLVFEDALLYRTQKATYGLWESVSVAGALAAVTSRIHVGHSVLNAPYRSPAMTAKIATTLDEISGGATSSGSEPGTLPTRTIRRSDSPPIGATRASPRRSRSSTGSSRTGRSTTRGRTGRPGTPSWSSGDRDRRDLPSSSPQEAPRCCD